MVNSRTIGEHEIIKLIHKHLTAMPNMPVPFGDDVSATALPSGVAVLKTDMLVAATDVPKQMTLYDAARKAIVMNISDFASKGVVPTASISLIIRWIVSLSRTIEVLPTAWFNDAFHACHF